MLDQSSSTQERRQACCDVYVVSPPLLPPCLFACLLAVHDTTLTGRSSPMVLLLRKLLKRKLTLAAMGSAKDTINLSAPVNWQSVRHQSSSWRRQRRRRRHQQPTHPRTHMNKPIALTKVRGCTCDVYGCACLSIGRSVYLYVCRLWTLIHAAIWQLIGLDSYNTTTWKEQGLYSICIRKFHSHTHHTCSRSLQPCHHYRLMRQNLLHSSCRQGQQPCNATTAVVVVVVVVK